MNYQSPTKQIFDTENNINSPGGPLSSPFVADVASSPAEPSSPSKQNSPPTERSEDYGPRKLTEDALKESENLTWGSRPIENDPMRTDKFSLHDDTVSAVDGGAGYPGMDDTAFSAFSAVPNVDMTHFARIDQSPTKSMFGSPPKPYGEEAPSPRPRRWNTPSRNKPQSDDGFSSPTPRRQKTSRDNDTTNLLIDLTGQFNPAAPLAERSPSRNGRLSPTKYTTQADLSSYASSRRTPSPAKHPLPPGTPSESRHLANLLDFDLPPAPTPRSIPSISARELESMKSAFQSQISSLKAEVSGREAEVKSLKNAMGDAERRVGEAQEQVREERDAKEVLQSEKADWEKRQQEMQSVLRDVREEIVRGDREKETLQQRVTEAECKREEAEAKAMEVESKIAGLQVSSSATAPSDTPSTNTNSEVQAAVTKVATELHGLYKSKHEAKVTALKKSYSDRWEKKIKDLQTKIDELSKENDDLRTGRDATMTGVDPGTLGSNTTPESEAQREKETQERREQAQRLEDQARKLSAAEQDLSTLKGELANFKVLNASLTSQLESSRSETAELIAATEELMALSQSALGNSSSGSSGNCDSQTPAPTETRAMMSRSTSGSGLKAPGFGGYSGESRIGRVAPSHSVYGRDGSRSGNGPGGRSGLLGNIERMGRGRAVE